MPEHLTKRLKKILAIAGKIEKFQFEQIQKVEQTGLKLEEKFIITKIIADQGIDTSKEKPFAVLKAKVCEKTNR